MSGISFWSGISGISIRICLWLKTADDHKSFALTLDSEMNPAIKISDIKIKIS